MANQATPTDRITVAEAFRRLTDVITSNENEKRFPDHLLVYTTEEQGRATSPAELTEAPRRMRVERKSGKEMAVEQLRSAFASFCKQSNVTPRSLLNPWGAAPYVDHSQDYTYDISFDEYEAWAQPYQQQTTPRGSPDKKDISSGPVGTASARSAEVLTESPVQDEKVGKRELQIQAIEAMAAQEGYPALSIPHGGKKKLCARCMAKSPLLFGTGEDPFKDAWKEALRQGRLRTTDHMKYSGR